MYDFSSGDTNKCVLTPSESPTTDQQVHPRSSLVNWWVSYWGYLKNMVPQAAPSPKSSESTPARVTPYKSCITCSWLPSVSQARLLLMGPREGTLWSFSFPESHLCVFLLEGNASIQRKHKKQCPAPCGSDFFLRFRLCGIWTICWREIKICVHPMNCAQNS